MLNPYISCFVYAVVALIYNTFFSRINKSRFSPVISCLFAVLLFEVVSVINLIFSNNVWINTTSMIIVSTVLANFSYKKKMASALYYSIILTVIAFALELVVIIGLSALIGVETTKYNKNVSILFLEFLSCKALFFLASILLSNFTKESYIRKVPLTLFVYPCTTAVCLFVFWYICLEGDIGSKSQFFLSLTSGVLLVSSIFMFNTFQSETEKEYMLARVQAENSQLKTERDYYEILERQNQELLIYAHDTAKHLSAIQELSEDPRIDDYVSKLSGQLKSYAKSCHSGNMLLDVMINRYRSESIKRGISFEYDVRNNNLSHLDSNDLVSILGNLLDNSLRAAEQSEQKTIYLTAFLKNKYSVILITNSCDHIPKARGEELYTTKDNTEFHGYGLKSVATTLKKYGGDLYWKFDEVENVFTMTVMIGI